MIYITIYNIYYVKKCVNELSKNYVFKLPMQYVSSGIHDNIIKEKDCIMINYKHSKGKHCLSYDQDSLAKE